MIQEYSNSSRWVRVPVSIVALVGMTAVFNYVHRHTGSLEMTDVIFALTALLFFGWLFSPDDASKFFDKIVNILDKLADLVPTRRSKP
jgi:hypothetical protein